MIGTFSYGTFSDGMLTLSGGMISDGMFSGSMFSDGTFSDRMFSDGTFSDGIFSGGMFSDGTFRRLDVVHTVCRIKKCPKLN